MTRDPEFLDHQEWLGYVQPVGLVVSIPALLAAQAHVNRNIAPQHAKLLACLPRDRDGELIPEIRDFTEFTRTVLDWRESDLERVTPGDPSQAALEVHLPEYQETLRPTYAVREYEPKDANQPWMLLIQSLPAGTHFDKLTVSQATHWQATPHAKFERLLRETRVPVGLLVSPSQMRLIYAPRGETSGYMTFSVAEMAQVAGRPLFAALHMLLSEERLFSLGEKQRLPAILADSRKYQNHVSNELAQQVLAALFELLRGFQAADDASKGELLREVLTADPNHVYGGLLTVLMRFVFILYAEDRDLVSSDPVYSNHYSLTGLFDRLRADAGRYPDSMDQRYGAWAQLLTLFRLIYEGGSHGGLKIPARKGYLFDPDRYNFLEGRSWKTARRHADSAAAVPRISDGVVFRVLHNLLILDGERLSYRTLDVEQIGSVYETIMGFAVEVAQGRSIALKPKKSHGAPATINLESLLAAKPADRSKWLKEHADQEVAGQALAALKEANTVEDLLAALDRKIARNVTPNVVSKGSMVFQPSDERRRSGSHYTPRTLTEPIVRTALLPVLSQFGGSPTPDQILTLKVCDPAMGSGAFLVEACRQLGDELVNAWHRHDCVPRIPPDEDEILHARRLIAQRCLYGVDKNPMAVDLSKMSLWLATLAKDHPFTFLDHSLRAGDSLVGLTREQIVEFHWKGRPQRVLGQEVIEKRIHAATARRKEILDADDSVPELLKVQKLALADEALQLVRFTGNLVATAFFAADTDRTRQAKRDEYLSLLSEYLRNGKIELRPAKEERSLREGEHPIEPFHWEIEFPEVFSRKETGFDVIVGNPPFAGKNTIGDGNRSGFLDWLKTLHEESHGNADLVAHFFRRAFTLLRPGGTFGLIATNTIAQGDTRSSGLRWICTHGGTIYAAKRRYKWPGQAAVVVSVVHVAKNATPTPFELDGRSVERITAYLFHAGGHDDPSRLIANYGKNFTGVSVYGPGFTFDDTDNSGAANPISLMNELIAKDKRNAERIFPYIGGEEVNDSPTHAHHRYVINFGEMSETEARKWPEVMRIVEEKVKPERQTSVNRDVSKWPWWQFWRIRGELSEATRGMKNVIGISRVGEKMGFALLPANTVFADSLVLLTFESFAAFATLQSRLHEVWARFFASSLEDRLRYTPSDCFETFPFPEGFEAHPALAAAGKAYYEFRGDLMVRNDEGLTKTYNRFHDPNEQSTEILKLRELHDAMDHALLDAYGWHDLAQTATRQFLLDYEDDEDDEELTIARARTRKKPWRYRWPDDFRDEVLARLLALNAERAEQERLAGETAAAAAKGAAKSKAAKPTKPRTKAAVLTGDLFQEERDRERFYILLLLRAWKKPVTRNALDAGLILLLNDDLRGGVLGKSTNTAKTNKLRIVNGLDYVLQELEALGYLLVDNSGAQQVLTALPKAPSTDSPPAQDAARLQEVKEFFERERQRGNVTETKEHVDAKPDLILA